jgi:hypothetical protein
MIALPRQRHGVALFTFLSIADLALTAHLLRLGAGGVYEANWLAGWVLSRHGLQGLAIFKGLIVLLVAGLAGAVYMYRPGAARRLVTFGCLSVGGVVLYSTFLWAQLELQPLPPGHKDLATIARDRQDLRERMHRADEFRSVLRQRAADLAAGRCTLDEALAGLATAIQARDAGFLAIVRETLGAPSDAAGLAALAVRDAVVLLHEDGTWQARRRAEALLVAYQAAHGPALSLAEAFPFPLADVFASPQRRSRPALAGRCS